MKRKILFLILLLLPFMVKALDLSEFNLKWKVEGNYYYGSYATQNAFIEYDLETLTSIDKITGSVKKINNPENSIHIFVDEKIIVLSDGENNNFITTYNDHLDELNKETTETFIPNYVGTYNDYILFSGNQCDKDTCYLVIVFVDKDGNIYKTDKYKTFKTVSAGCYLEEADITYYDFNFNFYKIENYKIVPTNMNSDGTHMYLTNDRLYRVSSDGELLNSVEIPDGKGTRIAKKGNNYYLASGVYDYGTNITNVGLTIYKIDENLNIIKTADIPNPGFAITYIPKEEGMPYLYHTIGNRNGEIYAYIYQNSDNKKSYLISEDLEISLTNQYTSMNVLETQNYINGIRHLTLHSPEEYSYEVMNNVSSEEREAINEKIKLDEANLSAYIRKYNDGYLVTARYYSCEGEGCSRHEPERIIRGKVELFHLDSNLNIIKRKEVYDWEYILKNYGYDNPDNQIFKHQGVGIIPYDNFFIVLGTASSKNVLYVMDQDWNIVRDYSSDIEKYEYLSAVDLYTTEKGFYVALQYNGFYEDHNLKGATATIQNGIVRGKELYLKTPYDNSPIEDNVYSAILYYSMNYGISKQITGKGTINSTVERAEEGEVVKFTVTPDPGYVLSVVKVTDANGNVLTFTNNTFVMPSSNVTIEAIFTPKNPNTGDIAILAILLIALSSLVIFALEKRRLNTLK